MRSRTTGIVWAGLCLIVLAGAAQARDYSYQEIAEYPMQLDRKMLQVNGVVGDLKRRGTDSGSSYWSFKLLEQSSGRYINVTWYVFACNRLISDFNLRSGQQAVVLGEFRRASMTRVTNFLGNLYVNDQAKSEACKDQYRRKYRSR